MSIRQSWTAALLCCTIFACGRGGSNETAPRGDSPRASEAVANTQSGSGHAAALIGSWQLDRIPPQRIPGLSITITIDSASGIRYYGRLSHYFAGNVGQDPRRFTAFADSIQHDGSLQFVIPAADRDMPGMAMVGKLAADTIDLDTLVFGPDTIRSGDYRWILVRRP